MPHRHLDQFGDGEGVRWGLYEPLGVRANESTATPTATADAAAVTMTAAAAATARYCR